MLNQDHLFKAARTTVLLDFDHTIFDAAAFKEVLRDTICVTVGVDTEQYDAMYSHVRKVAKRGPSVAAYVDSFEATGVELSANQRAVLEQAVQGLMVDTSIFVFPDVAKFLNAAALAEAELVIVSFGDPEFQHAKIHSSGLEIFFSDVRYQETGDKKDEILAEIISERGGERIVYVEDRGDLIDSAKRAHPDILAYRVTREGGAYADTPSELIDGEEKSMQQLARTLFSCAACDQTVDDHSHEGD